MTDDALTTYLSSTSMSLSMFAEKIGRSPSTLTRALNGARNPSIKLAREIEQHTKGEVTARDFIDLCLSPSKTKRRRTSAPAETERA